MASQSQPAAQYSGPRATVKPELLRLLDELPPARQAELLNFARFLRQQVAAAYESVDATLAIREAPTDSLVYLTSVVALGGDAVTDAETRPLAAMKYRLVQQLLNSSPAVHSLLRFEHRLDEGIAQFKAIALLIDGSRLHVNEVYLHGALHKYAYYWLTPIDKLIVGWDNAPHHPRLLTYPSHQHNEKLRF